MNNETKISLQPQELQSVSGGAAHLDHIILNGGLPGTIQVPVGVPYTTPTATIHSPVVTIGPKDWLFY